MSLATWVSDELHDVTGMSDRNLAGKFRTTNTDVELYTQHHSYVYMYKKNLFRMFLDFFIGLAKKSKSADNLIDKIRDTEALDISDRVKTFATQLYER